MPAEIPGGPPSPEVSQQPASYNEFVKHRIDQLLPREATEGTVSRWYHESLENFSNIRASRAPQLESARVGVEKKGAEIAQITLPQGGTIEGYKIRRKNPNGSEFSWHQPGVHLKSEVLAIPTENGGRVNRLASSVTVILRDPETGEILLAPKQDTYAATPKNMLIGNAIEASLSDMQDILNGKKNESTLAGAIKMVGGDDSLETLVRNKKVEFFTAPPTDGNRTNERPQAIVINITDKGTKNLLTQGTGRRWCSVDDITQLIPVLEGATAAGCYAAAGSKVKDYEADEARGWFEERLTKIGTLEVAHAETVTDGDKWKGSDEKVKGGHFEIVRDLVAKEGQEGTEESVGIYQTESDFEFPNKDGGTIKLLTSGIVGLVMDNQGRVLLSVEPEPLVVDPQSPLPSTTKVGTYEPRGLLRTMQFSAQKLKELIAGENVDVGLGEFFKTIGGEANPKALFSTGEVEVSILPPADPDVIKASNLQLVMKVNDVSKQNALIAGESNRRWFTIREALALAREGKVNAHTAAALLETLKRA